MTATATALGSVLVGFDARLVVVTATVEASPRSLSISGLPDVACREARVRVRSALLSDPRTWSPIDLGLGLSVRVEGVPDGVSTAGLDLAIAVAILRAAGVPLPHLAHEREAVFVGELALDGRVRPVRGALRHVDGRPLAVVPRANGWEAGLASPLGDVYAVDRLSDVADGAILRSGRVRSSTFEPYEKHGPEDLTPRQRVALEECRGARRALLVGPPGSGRTMIARRLATSEVLSESESREVAAVHGVAGLLSGSFGYPGLTLARPFRAPHHTASTAALIGNGMRPGEVSLAHRGVLLLDELPEFRREAIAALETVLRDRAARSGRLGSGGFPAEPRYVIAAANPCPCGYAYAGGRACLCSRDSRERYETRLSELAGRLGLKRVELPAVTLEDLAGRSLNQGGST